MESPSSRRRWLLFSFAAMPLSRRRSFRRRLLPVPLGVNAELMPIDLGKIHMVVPCRLLDVREREGAIGIGHIDHLVESCHGIAHMPGIGQRLFPLLWIRKDRVGQVASLGEAAVLFVRFPGCFY